MRTCIVSHPYQLPAHLPTPVPLPALPFRRYVTGPLELTKHSQYSDTQKKKVTFEEIDGEIHLIQEPRAKQIIDIYENQRHKGSAGDKGWGSKFPGHLLPTDRDKFTDNSGNRYYKPGKESYDTTKEAEPLKENALR